MIEKTKTIYVALDGREFYDKEDCEAYEAARTMHRKAFFEKYSFYDQRGNLINLDDYYEEGRGVDPSEYEYVKVKNSNAIVSAYDIPRYEGVYRKVYRDWNDWDYEEIGDIYFILKRILEGE